MRRPRQPDDAGEIAELAALADGSLSPGHRAALEARVAASSELADRLAEQERAVALSRSAAAEAVAPARLRARIDAERNARRAATSRRLSVIGATAFAGVAAVVGLVVFGSGTSNERLHAALAATNLAPRAAGKATLTRTSSGWRIELEGTRLPRLANGRFYEAWLRNSDGVLVPIGTFTESRKVTLWAGVSPTEFPRLTVTRERADGDQAASGETVLAGTVDGSD